MRNLEEQHHSFTTFTFYTDNGFEKIFSVPSLFRKCMQNSHNKVFSYQEPFMNEKFKEIFSLKDINNTVCVPMLSKAFFSFHYSFKENDSSSFFKFGLNITKQFNANEWCKENCRSPWSITTDSLFFSDSSDMALYKLLN